MKKTPFLILSLIMLSLTSLSQVNFTKFKIPKKEEEVTLEKSTNCESCNAVLDPELRKKTIYYKQSNLRDWIYQYFVSNEEQRRMMKNSASNNSDLSAVVKSIPITFGYSSNESNDYNYWNKKYMAWSTTRLISIDDIAYLFKSNSEDQLKKWLDCKKISCAYSAANYADEKIYLDIEKIRDGKYNISLTNLSLANIKITEINVDEVLEKTSGKKLRVNGKVGNKGGKVTVSYSSKSTVDVNFSIMIAYDILGTEDQGVTMLTYKVKPDLPDTPIGTIVSTTLTYEQFLRINQIENLSSSEQIWLPCDGRAVPNGIFITKTPDLRGLFIRGANIMDINEKLHTKPVDNKYKNPNNSKIGEFQADEFKTHSHSEIKPQINNGLGAGATQSWYGSGESIETGDAGGNETRPKNITVLYLIRVK